MCSSAWREGGLASDSRRAQGTRKSTALKTLADAYFGDVLPISVSPIPVRFAALPKCHGFPTGISGQRLANRAFVQALKFGVRFAVSRDAITLERYGDLHKITLEDQISLCSRAVVIATGAQYRKLPLENFERFENQGIYYAATGMETAYCHDKEVVVVGGGNSAGQAALFLSQTAAHVYIMVHGKSLAATMSQYLLSRIEQSRRITILTGTEIVSLEGRSHLEQVTWVDRRDGSETTKAIQDLFVMIGAQPNTSWLKGVVALDEKGFVITGGPQGFDSTPYV